MVDLRSTDLGAVIIVHHIRWKWCWSKETMVVMCTSVHSV